MRILILGASYGSLLSTKLLMAGHDVSLVCRSASAKLINEEGTVVRMQLRRGEDHKEFRSGDLPGSVDAIIPEDVEPEAYDLVALAMQEPQYSSPSVRDLMHKVAESGKPCLSIMNMPPLPFLKRIPKLANLDFSDCYTDARVWDGFKPGLVSLCSPDPQAFRPPDEGSNVLFVGLASNFKATAFEAEKHNEMLSQLERDITAVRIDGKRVPVKLSMHQSLFVPMAKWSMLLTGNYRCVLQDSVQSIRDAVHADIELSETIYSWVDDLARTLGAETGDLVPFSSYAKAAENLLKPSSVARAIAEGVKNIERVDKLVQRIGAGLEMQLDAIDDTVGRVDHRLEQNASA
ncbi:MAG: hypothetical protein AAGA53_05635 [Pseudomonadota bacterium]